MRNLLIIFFLIVLFEFNGYLLMNKLKIRTEYYIIFGFLSILSVFEILSLPFIIWNISFGLYKPFILILLAIGEILFLRYTRCDKKKIKDYIDDFSKQKVIVCIISAVIGLYIGIVSINSSDSWLYLPMVLDPLQTGSMVYNDIGNHMYDTYYKFLSIITSFSNNHYLFLMLWYKFLETFLILNGIAFISEQIFGEKKLYAFLIMCFGIVFQVVYIIPSFSDIPALGALYKVSPNGTVMILLVMIPILYVYMYKRFNNKILITILILSMLSLSSSTIFLYLFYILIHSLYMVFIKEKSIKDIYMFEVGLLSVPLIIFLLYKIIPLIFVKGTFILIFFGLIISYAVFIVVTVLIKEKHFSKFIIITVIITYILNLIMVISAIKINQHLGVVPAAKVFDNRFNDDVYPMILSYGIYTVFFLVGLWYTFRYNRNLIILTLSGFIMAGNYFFFRGIGRLISNVVYDRVYIFLGLYIFVIFGIIYLLMKVKDIINNPKAYQAVIVVMVVGLVFYYEAKDNLFHYDFYDFKQSIIEYKVNNPDVLDLVNYPFAKSNYVQTPDEEKWSQGINQIFEFNTSLEKVNLCNNDCYILAEQVGEYGPELITGNIVYETENYKLIYKENNGNKQIV